MEPMLPTQVPTVSVAELRAGAYIVDVREPHEWVAGHAPSARHVPMHELPARLDEIPTEGEVVIACRVGARSAQVTAWLRAQGRENVANLAGGMIAWEAAGRPLRSDDEATPRIV